MKKLRFKKINAFASKLSSGNPAAVIYLDKQDDLSDLEKQQIAKELQGFVGEVGYVCPGTDTDFELCYFSSEREVAFCGHATIAIMNDIVVNDEALHFKAMLSVATRRDRLQVENHYRDEKSVYVSAPLPRFSTKEVDKVNIATALNCNLEEIGESRPIQIINGGLETLVVPMTGLSSILRVRPYIQMLKDFCLQYSIDILLLFSSEVASPESRYRTRVFAPTFGYLEDPATGSGNAAFGYYLLSLGMWNGERMTIEQNRLRDTPNFVQLLSKETSRGDSQVWFGGGAIVKIDGQYILG